MVSRTSSQRIANDTRPCQQLEIIKLAFCRLACGKLGDRRAGFCLDDHSTTASNCLDVVFQALGSVAATITVSSNLLGAKGVATRNLSGFQAGQEPTGALRRSTVGKCVGHYVALSSPL
jgi:hypothetical protein